MLLPLTEVIVVTTCCVTLPVRVDWGNVWDDEPVLLVEELKELTEDEGVEEEGNEKLVCELVEDGNEKAVEEAEDPLKIVVVAEGDSVGTEDDSVGAFDDVDVVAPVPRGTN